MAACPLGAASILRMGSSKLGHPLQVVRFLAPGEEGNRPAVLLAAGLHGEDHAGRVTPGASTPGLRLISWSATGGVDTCRRARGLQDAAGALLALRIAYAPLARCTWTVCLFRSILSRML